MEFERKSDEICMFTNCKRLWDTMDYIRIKWLLVCDSNAIELRRTRFLGLRRYPCESDYKEPI